MLYNENEKKDETTGEMMPEELPSDADFSTSDENEADICQNTAQDSDEAKKENSPAEYAFRWDYLTEDKLKKEQKKSGKRGLLVYAVVMSLAFLFCALALAALLIVDHYTNDVVVRDRTVFVREYDSESGALTVPEIAEKVKPSVVGIKALTPAGESTGTGIVMSKDGYIAVNYSVCENATEIYAITSDGEEYEAKLIGADELGDLAVIKADADDLLPAEYGDSDSLVVGELAVAVGTSPELDYEETVASGIVSAICRDVKIYDKSTGSLKKKMTLIRTSANVYSSGGPLVDGYGKVVGIITTEFSEGNNGIGYAIPITTALKSLNEIIETGEDIKDNSTNVAEKRAVIGIKGAAVSSLEGYSSSGVLVVEVTEGYDAENYLKPGDIIIGINGNEVLDVSDISNVINSKRDGDEVILKISRDGKIFDVTVKLGYEKDGD